MRHRLTESEVTVELELERVANYTKYYFEALPLGNDLPSTELQPADDLALLAGNAYISLWKLTNDEAHLFNAVHLLEYTVTKSKHCFLARLILIRIYRILGKDLVSYLTIASDISLQVPHLMPWNTTDACKSNKSNTIPSPISYYQKHRPTPWHRPVTSHSSQNAKKQHRYTSVTHRRFVPRFLRPPPLLMLS